MARNQELDLRNYVFEKCLISFALFFDEDNIVKLSIDHSECEEIAAQLMVSCYSSKLNIFPFILLLLLPIEVIETRLFLFMNMFYHGF